MKRIIMLSISALLLAPAHRMALAHETDNGKISEPLVEHRLHKLTKKLKLTEDQQAKVKQLLQDEVSQMKPLHEQMKGVHEQTDDKINALLSDDQKKTFQDMKQKRREKMREHWMGMHRGDDHSDHCE